MRNVFTGFDTEFENVDMRYNKLLSVQVAVCGELMIRVPLYTPYTLHSINTLTSEKYSRTLTNFYIAKDEINKLIDDRIRCIRHMKLNNNDVFLTYLSRVLDSLAINKVVKKVETSDKDYSYYIFERGNIIK